jgi:Protein of unknown function (DUF3043)
LFRRSKSEPESAAPAVDLGKSGQHTGKGRPTPSRKEAEAAAKARAKAPRTRKELAKAQRAARAESSGRMREAMRTGDERFLPTRDKGPVKRFIRDFVDSRLSFIELLLPVLLLTIILSYTGNQLAAIANSIMMGALLLVVFDMIVMRFRLRKQLVARFPNESLRGTTAYAVMRSMQMKFMRLPKSQVKLGQKLPENYR